MSSWINSGNSLFGGGGSAGIIEDAGVDDAVVEADVESEPAPQEVVGEGVAGDFDDDGLEQGWEEMGDEPQQEMEPADSGAARYDDGPDLYRGDVKSDPTVSGMVGDKVADSRWLDHVPTKIMPYHKLVVIHDSVEARISARVVLSKIAVRLGLEIVQVYRSNGVIGLLCRNRYPEKEDLLLDRLAIMVDGGVGVYKKYLVKDGNFVYGWLLVFREEEAIKAQEAVVEAMEIYPNPPIQKVKISLTGKPVNPVGSYRGANPNLAPGQGYGVEPVRQKDVYSEPGV